MPTLQLKLTPPLAAPAQAALAAELTQLTATVLGKRPEVTAVLVEALPPTQWFIGGVLVTQATAWLAISITAGTNTAAQKADFIAQAYALLQRHLGPLAPASYVIVQELPASDWGYGGQTQAARQAARQRVAQPA
jgi:4-oxalocrotonate tautomerase